MAETVYLAALDVEALHVDDGLGAVTRRLATYNLVSLPVTDAQGRLLGAVTVDDVLDHILPEDWREADDAEERAGARRVRDAAASPRADMTFRTCFSTVSRRRFPSSRTRSTARRSVRRHRCSWRGC